MDSTSLAYVEDWRPRLAHRMAARNVAGRTLILDPNIDRLLRLNGSGSMIWAWIAEQHCSLAEMVENLTEQFEVEVEQARIDLLEFMTSLVNEGLVDAPPACWQDDGTL